jgi:glucose-6-phosphate dehydrogenase assembly protein OpcA
MTTLQSPLVSLQAPKDVSLEGIETELRGIWQNYSSGEDGLAPTRAATFTLIVCEPETPLDSPDGAGANIADAIASANPCRIITLCPIAGTDSGISAQVAAYCPTQKRNQQAPVCCENVTLRGTAGELERMAGMISELAIGGLPKFVWWKANPQPKSPLFQKLAAQCDTIIIDSSDFENPEASLKQVGAMLAGNAFLADLNWERLAPWQELAAQAFDPPERRAAIPEIDRLTVDYEQGNVSQALMFLGWVASRLQWQPASYSYEGGDYDIRRVTFTTADQRAIEAELAGIPLADAGEVLGDLISIKMSSTNLQADCCTVICSGTTGCMRMEAAGGAQSCRIQQVTALDDQKTDGLLVRQLQRWGRDQLYVEGMGVAYQILQL